MGGGMLKETVLWTNPSPTSSMLNQTRVTLSQSIMNFEYIKFYARISTSNSKETALMVSASDFQNMTDSTNRGRLTICAADSSSSYARFVNYVDNTTVEFSNARRLGNTTTSNSNTIPTKITGLK